MATATQGRFNSAMNRANTQGREAEDEYLRRAQEYDPQESIDRSARASFDSVRGDMNEAVGDLRGQQVGMGRLDTGFATGDEDRLVRSAYDRLNNTLSQNAMFGEQLSMQNTQALGRFGSEQSGRYLDLMSGQMDREQAARNAQKERQAGLFGGIAKLAGGALGSLLGPAGTAVGAKLGGVVGGWLGQSPKEGK